MKYDLFQFLSKDGVKIAVHKWEPDNKSKIKAIIQIAHGMAEHAARYVCLARFLVEKGFVVYANDHRGHGQTAGQPERIGYFADVKGWERIVSDMYQLTEIIKNEYPGLSVFLFGHSMGSLLARDYITEHGQNIAGVIFSGTAGRQVTMADIGILIARWEIRRRGRKGRSPLLNRLTFSSYNSSFKNTSTEFDWLSRDRAEVERYINDPYCGGVFTAGFFLDLLQGIKKISKIKHFKEVPENLPIFLISGAEDPVGNRGKGVNQVYLAYQKAGIKDLSLKLYQGARHELINEINRDEVYADLYAWLTARI